MNSNRTKCLFPAAVCVLAFGLAGQAFSFSSKEALSPEQVLSLRTISDLRFAPNGRLIAFVVSEPTKGTSRARHIWMLNPQTKELRQFTNSTKSEEAPRWSPDGKKLAFISDRDEIRQVYLMPSDGGEATKFTQGKQSIQSFSWSPDGKQVAFLASESKTEEDEKKEKEKDDAHVVDHDEKLARLWVQDVDTGKVRQVTSGRWRVNEAEWLPDGKRLLISGTDQPEALDHSNRICEISLADAKISEIVAPQGPFRSLRVSPDGSTLAFIGPRVDGPDPHDLYILSLRGHEKRNLTGAALDRPVQSYQWLSNRELMAVVHEGFERKLVSITTESKVAPSVAFPVNPSTFDISSAGVIAAAGATTTEPEELWIQAGKEPAQRLSDFNKNWRTLSVARPEIISFKSFDGLEIESALLKPPNYQAGTRVPLVVLVHGGPTGAWTDSLEPWGQLLAAQGFAVLYPNVRGSSGYGQRFIELNRGDWGGGDFRDIMAGIDYLIQQGIADPDRLGIGGWSYGGFMAEWAITQTNRFKAAVSGAGMSNLASEFGTENQAAGDKWYYGVPYENLDNFMKSSPLKYLKNVHTPTLILQGEADTTDPLGQSQELYRGLKYYGVQAELVVYPREGHGLREEKHLVDRLTRILAWYQNHLGKAVAQDQRTAGQSPTQSDKPVERK